MAFLWFRSIPMKFRSFLKVSSSSDPSLFSLPSVAAVDEIDSGQSCSTNGIFYWQTLKTGDRLRIRYSFHHEEMGASRVAATLPMPVASPPSHAVLTHPAPGDKLTDSSASISWTPGNQVTEYQLWVGTRWPGSSNLYNSFKTTATSALVTGLPTNGETVYARLWSQIDGAWQAADFVYTAVGTAAPAILMSPAPGGKLTSSSPTFSWTPGSGVTEYQLWLGSSFGNASNLYESGITAATYVTVCGLPTNGEAIYARLWSRVNEVWQFTGYTFAACGTKARPFFSLRRTFASLGTALKTLPSWVGSSWVAKVLGALGARIGAASGE
jgi:hypothetical protein